MTSTLSKCFTRTQNESMDKFKIMVGKMLLSYQGEMSPKVIAKKAKEANQFGELGFTPFQLFCVVQDICSFFGVSFSEKPTVEEYDQFVKKYLI